MTTKPTEPGVTAPPRRSAWFVNGWFDFLFIVGVPFLVWPLVMVGQRMGSAELLGKLILLTATGHYFATFVRTYGDRLLVKRFKARLTVVPAVLLVTCVWAFTRGQAAPLLLVTSGWAWWHWLAQAFGFARIYDAKIGSFRRLTAWLDKLLVISWFLGAIVLNSSATANFAQLFLNCGMALPPAGFFEVLRTVVHVAVVFVTIAYVANVIWTLVRGERVSWIKQACHVMTIGFYWFAFGFMPNFFVSYVLYELFHDIQYFAIVWISSRSRVQRGDVTGWMRRMFRPGWTGVGIFLGITVAFGAIDLGGRELGEERFTNVLMGVFLTTALLHYYFDGFIWKVRESDIRHDFDLEGGTKAHTRKGLVHVASWAFFFVPLVVLANRARTTVTPLGEGQMLVAAAPGSFEAQGKYAFALAATGDIDRALEHYRKSIAAYDGSAQITFNYASALDVKGNIADAKANYRRALELDDPTAVHARAHINLGVCLLMEGDSPGALAEFKAGRVLGGPSPLERMFSLSQALASMGQTERAQRMHAAAVGLQQAVGGARR